jgi:hypothetical protein
LGAVWEANAKFATVEIEGQSPVTQLNPGNPFDLIDTEEVFSLVDAQGRHPSSST